MKSPPGTVQVRPRGHFLNLERLGVGESAVRFDHPDLGPGWLSFERPLTVCEARSADEVGPLLAEVEQDVEKGRHAVGFLAYEAGCAMEPKIQTVTPTWRPLAWFALFEEPPAFWRELEPGTLPPSGLIPQPEMDSETYATAFKRVKEELGAGSTYQVNLTFRTRFPTRAAAHEFFAARCGVNPPTYATFIQGGEWQIASFSPELFFERCGTRVTMRPMKGTAPVHRDRDSTAAEARRLAGDVKTKAENLMIVDMVRNDLGRVADVGTVNACDLMRVERHGNILQVTSTVTAQVGCSTAELMESVFPPASVTGAPKVSTCGIIADLEISPRHIYCGAIGFLAPGRAARFSVAIRTALIDSKRSTAEYGVGSGVVWDSDCEAEYQECLLKANVLSAEATPWRLIEAIHVDSLRDPEILGCHMERLSRSAEHFAVPLNMESLHSELKSIVVTPEPERRKVRITVSRDGAFQIAVGRSEIDKPRLSAVLARKPLCSADPNLRHKTTSRAVYDAHLDEAPECDEVLLFNERGEVTEFCRGNAVFRVNGYWLTPSPECGCLAGVGVGRLVRRAEVRFSSISVEEALSAEEVHFVNAVTGRVPVTLSKGFRGAI